MIRAYKSSIGRVISIIILAPFILGIFYCPILGDQIKITAITDMRLKIEGGANILDLTVTIRNTWPNTIRWEDCELSAAFFVNDSQIVELGEVLNKTIEIAPQASISRASPNLHLLVNLGSNLEQAVKKLTVTLEMLSLSPPQKVNFFLKGKFVLVPTKGVYEEHCRIEWNQLPEITKAQLSTLLQEMPKPTPTAMPIRTPPPPATPSPMPTLSPTPIPTVIPTLSPTPMPTVIPTLPLTPTPTVIPTLPSTPTPSPRPAIKVDTMFGVLEEYVNKQGAIPARLRGKLQQITSKSYSTPAALQLDLKKILGKELTEDVNVRLEEGIVTKTVIYFAFDDSTIGEIEGLPNQQAKLQQWAACCSNCKGTGVTLHLEGHADARGTLEYNQRLSENRAQEVYHYLEETYQLRAWNLHAILPPKGFGKTRPVVQASKEEEHQQNRRVEIYFTDVQGKPQAFVNERKECVCQ